MRYTVGFYMKGQGKQYRGFITLEAARLFMRTLEADPACECYTLESNLKTAS